MATAVSTDRLTKDFRTGFWRPTPFRALDDLTLEIPVGGVFGLLGPNGAGKSTTLKLLMNLLWPTSGRAEILGFPPGHLEARRQLGFLPEHPTFYDHLSARELLTYYAGLFGLRGADKAARADAVLDEVGLDGDARRRRIRSYSKGMVQRVGLAQALVNDPALVVLDEPMSGLDPLGRREVRELILQLRDAGRTVLFSSHILSDAEALCSRVGILNRGRLVASGSLDELLAGRTGRGTEVIVADLPPEAADRLRAAARTTTSIAAGRYAFELAPEVRPEPFIAELAAAGATLVSVTPLRTTLEDVFVESVGAAPVHAHTSAARGGAAGGNAGRPREVA
ncbi:MAG: ABC transporter ATP-binding protein [Vicinamibacterales bacterium]